MTKKEKDKLKAGDIIETDKGESFKLDEDQAASLNEQINDEIDDSQDEPSPSSPALNTPRFNKLNKK